ncbi:MAG: hypothetical protein ABMA02_12820 [Saprospiraceae bacterium]
MKKNWLFGLILALYVASFFVMGRWPTLPYGGDAWGYYAHLPAAFIYHDIGTYDSTIAATRKYDPNIPDPKIDKYGLRETPIGKHIIKYPVGVPLLEVPFFGAAHIWAGASGGTYAPDGFSRPYMMLAGLGAIFYALLGLILLWRVLARYFPTSTVLALVVGISLATNLYYFSVYNSVMSHAFLFFLHAALIWTTIRFWERPGGLRAAAVGLAAGMIAITRTQEVIAAIIPLVWGLTNWASVRERVQFIALRWKWCFVAVLAFFAALFPQMLYWKMVGGSWLYFSYQGETFDFRHPHIWGGFTDFRNGWLIYTPIMILALVGLFRLRRSAPAALWPFFAFVPLHVFITYSWWCWTYINGFGSRPMVETYALMALPLGAFWQWGSEQLWKKCLNWVALFFFVWLNIFQTWQLREGILWTENGNRAHYLAIFGTLHPHRNALIAYDSGERQPDAMEVVPVRPLAHLGFEDSTAASRTTSPVFSGRYALQPAEEFNAEVELRCDTLGLQPGDWLRLSVRAYVRGADKIWNRDALATLVIEIANAEGTPIKIRSIRITSKIGNPDNSIWDTGVTDQWGEAAFFVKVPKKYRSDGRIKVYIWNPQRQKLVVDDLKISHWRK